MSAARISLALFWTAAGVMHFVRPRFYDAIVPPPLDEHARAVTYARGVAELAGPALLLRPGTSRDPRGHLLLLLAAVYPANVWMALEPSRFDEVPAWALYARLPVQFLFAWHAVAGTRTSD